MPKERLDWDGDDWPQKRSRRRDDDDDDERPRKWRSRRKPPPKSGFPIALILLLGGGLVLGITGVVFLITLQSKRGVPGPNANGAMNTTPELPVSVSPAVRPPLPPGWVEFKHPDCNVSVYCPEAMFPDASNSKEPFGTPLAGPDRSISKRFHTTSGRITCELLVCEYHPQLPADVRQKILKDWSAYGSHPTFWFNVVWSGHPAKKVSGARADAEGTLEVSRRMWVGNRYYKATISGTFGHPTNAQQTTFFDSFVLKE